MTFLENFHFLRPWWLLALLPAALMLYRMVQARDAASRWRGIIAPHLLPALIIQPPSGPMRGKPVLLIAFAWLLSIISLAGPAWHRDPALFADDKTAFIIVLKVTPSMRTQDVQPDRLARSVQKIRDLLALRPGAKAALIAYAGSPHIVAPLTSDPGIINTFADALDPSIMPTEGDAAVPALALASKILVDSKQPGSILLFTDSIPPNTSLIPNLTQLSNLTVLAPLQPGPELTSLTQAAARIYSRVIPLTPDNSDIQKITRDADLSAAQNTSGQDAPWHESGYALLPLALIALALCFRRGILASLSPQETQI